MNLSEMPAEKLLDELEEAARDKIHYLPHEQKVHALRVELLRRLQPVKPHCPKCGSADLTFHSGSDLIGWMGKMVCGQCGPKFPAYFDIEDWTDFAQFFTSGPSVLSREGEGKA